MNKGAENSVTKNKSILEYSVREDLQTRAMDNSPYSCLGVGVKGQSSLNGQTVVKVKSISHYIV